MAKLKDSGERQLYLTGANRDNPVGKGRMDLIPPIAILRLSRHFEDGARKYGENNWTKGIPNSRYIDAAIRHIFKYLAGCNDEPHLEAAVWNLCCLMHNEQLLPEMQDIPAWKGRTSNFLYPLDTELEEKPS
jgi:hypothetical protein